MDTFIGLFVVICGAVGTERNRRCRVWEVYLEVTLIRSGLSTASALTLFSIEQFDRG